jgi:hypothetical protein
MFRMIVTSRAEAGPLHAVLRVFCACVFISLLRALIVTTCGGYVIMKLMCVIL